MIYSFPVAVEQYETADGAVVRLTPTPSEWRRARRRLALAALACLVAGCGITLGELQSGIQLLFFELLPAAVGALWAARIVTMLARARPTSVVATDHSLRLERLDGTLADELDLAGVGSIRIGPDGFSAPWRWLKGPRGGLVVIRMRSGGRGLAIPPPLARHPVVTKLLARVLVASRSRGPVSLAGPAELVQELEELTGGMEAFARDIPPITVPAGWYPDPAGGPGTRWWDGRVWTEHLRPQE